MRKVWTIAQREYGAMVATKAFLLSITLMPVLMFGGVFVATSLKDVRDVSDKVVVVIDGTDGALFAGLEEAAEAHNASLVSEEDGSPTGPKIVLQRYDEKTIGDKGRLKLSDRVRGGEIEAFVEVPSGVFNGKAARQEREIRFHAQNAMLSDERRWIERSAGAVVREQRIAELDLDPQSVQLAMSPTNVAPLRLFQETEDGKASGADSGNELVGIFVPFGFLMLMFMVIFLSAQPMLESVLEEKSQHIAEVLLGSASPFQLMAGKLLGNVAGSLSIVLLYGLGGYAVAVHNDWGEFIPYALAPWFLIFQVLAVMLFSSLFMAVGAAVNQLKEAQSLLLPVWLLLASPMFVWLNIVREPNGPIATWMTFFPPATPMVMVMRLASESVISPWQIAAALVLLVASTMAGVFVAGRIFRVGILWQGQPPRIGELARWALRG